MNCGPLVTTILIKLNWYSDPMNMRIVCHPCALAVDLDEAKTLTIAMKKEVLIVYSCPKCEETALTVTLTTEEIIEQQNQEGELRTEKFWEQFT